MAAPRNSMPCARCAVVVERPSWVYCPIVEVPTNAHYYQVLDNGYCRWFVCDVCTTVDEFRWVLNSARKTAYFQVALNRLAALTGWLRRQVAPSAAVSA